MTMTFTFFGQEFDGTDVEIFLPPYNVPTNSKIVEQNRVTFDIAPAPNYAIRMRSSTTVYFRSGVCDLSIGYMDQAADNFGAAYWMINSAPVNTPANALSSMVPALPLMYLDDVGKDEFRLEILTLSTRGKMIAAVGQGTYMKASSGGVVTFNYEFQLSPNQSATTGRILNVETVQAKVQSANGASAQGFLANLVNNIVIGFMQNTIVATLESGVQQQIDNAIEAQIAADNIPAQVRVTALSVQITDATGITILPMAGLPGAMLCASELDTGSVRIRPLAQVQQLRAMRDSVLKGTTRGDAYIRLQSRHNAELVYLLIRYPDLLKQLNIVVLSGLRDIDTRSMDKSTLSERSALEGAKLLDMLGKLASPELANTVRTLIPEVKEFVGKQVAHIFTRRL